MITISSHCKFPKITYYYYHIRIIVGGHSLGGHGVIGWGVIAGGHVTTGVHVFGGGHVTCGGHEGGIGGHAPLGPVRVENVAIFCTGHFVCEMYNFTTCMNIKFPA